MTHISQQTNNFQKDAEKATWRSKVERFAKEETTSGFSAVAAAGVVLAVTQSGMEIHSSNVQSLTQAMGFGL